MAKGIERSEDQPRITIVTCMKDEGPFILEWLSWHIAIGVTDFLIFTNDCSDGTDEMLDYLDELGIVRHLPNPAGVVATDKPYWQPVALSYASQMKEVRNADYIISMDVDEFINVRVGGGQLSDLFEAVGDFDALSMSEVIHGSNAAVRFEEGWLKSLYPKHCSLTPGERRAQRGVKTIVKNSEKLSKFKNHRSEFHRNRGEVIWRDGSGRLRDEFMKDASLNGIDCRGCYDLVGLNHFPVRSLESYSAKKIRGDVVVKGKSVSFRYWRIRNFHEVASYDFSLLTPQAEAAYDMLFANDQKLMDFHKFSVEMHKKTIAEAMRDPSVYEFAEQIAKEAWRDVDNNPAELNCDVYWLKPKA